ncbi:MAG: arsenate reductase ArsC [Pseudonocardia sp.]
MATTQRRPDLGINQQLTLCTAAVRLSNEFRDVFDTGIIERFLRSSYDELTDRAIVTDYPPLLAERFARERLQALAKVESEGSADGGPPAVLFLCTHNAGRSQMAMGFLQHLAGDQVITWSGGSKPGTHVNPAAVEAMAERGIDISTAYPKPQTEEMVRAADVIVTMGCGDTCPVFPGCRYEEWALDDPIGLDIDTVRPIRDEIERRVHTLLEQLEVAAGPQR